MASVTEDPAARLYAGALLGKALAKQAGEVGAQQEGIGLSSRKATLEAGIASGKLDPRKLSGQDAALLGSALSGGHVHIPSLIKDPLGFLGGLAKNFAHGAGEFASDLKGIPQGLYGLGKAGVEEAGVILTPPQLRGKKTPLIEKGEQIGQSIGHDFSSPHQIYEHPFNPVLDVATVASAGAGAAVKGAGALARAGRGGEIASNIASLGSTLGRSDAIASPSFTAKNVEHFGPDIVPAKISRPYSPNLGMKYVVQKPLDATVSKLRDIKLPGSEETLGDLQGRYYGRKLINRTRAQISAGTNQEFMNGPVKDFLKSTHRMYQGSPAAGQYQFEAAMLHSLGINDLEKLDSYVEHLRAGEDVDGLILSPDMQKAAHYRAEQLYQDPRFRQLIEHPTDPMKEVAYNLRRMNAEQAAKLDIDPLTSENSAFGRLRALTGKTNEEIRGELPAALQPFNKFAKGLQLLQEALQGKGVADKIPTVQELAYEIPYGTVQQKVKILEQAVESLKRDLADTESPFTRMQDPTYIQGNNLFEKVATALHDQLGIDSEQAQAFARGVALGSPEGPILPTYVPSVSGEKLKFGIRREPVRTKVGRVLGVSKFQPLEDIERQPTFYDFKRPFNPRTASAQTIGLGPAMNYTKEANYGAFLKGAMRLDPEAIARNAYQIQRDLITGRLNDEMIRRLAIKAPDGTAKIYRGEGEMFADLGTQAALYKFVPIDTWRNFFKTKTELQFDVAQAIKEGGDEADLASEIEGLANEAAQRFVAEEEGKAALGHTQGVALPITYIKTIVAHARLSEEGNVVGRAMSFLTGRWKSAVLSLMPSWLMRTTIGHGLVAVIDGTVNPKFWTQAHDYFSDRPILPEHVKAVAWGDKYGDHVLNPSDEKPVYGYHGTTAAEANRIMQEGFRTGGAHFTIRDSDMPTRRRFARPDDISARDLAHNWSTDGTVIRARLDGLKDLDTWEDEGAEGSSWEAHTKEPIPAHRLERLLPGDKETFPFTGPPKLNPQPLPYGVNQGGMMHELEDLGQGGGNGPLDIAHTLPARTITKGVHIGTNFQRRAIFLRNLDRGAKQRLAELGRDFEHPGGFWNAKNIDAVLDPEWRAEVLKYPDLVEHAFDQLGKASYTFGEMSPWERKLVKYGMPFWGWYKFITKFVWALPINYPGRAMAIAAIGHLGVEEHEELGAIPDYLEGALWFDHSDLSKARYINLYGLNPLQDPANPFGASGPVESVVRLGQFSPLVQAAMAAYGINPLTGQSEEIDPNSGIETGKYGELIDTKTGKEIPNAGAVNPLQRAVGTFLRAFPEIRAAELLNTHGNPVYPESIPLLDEHPIAVKPQSRRGYNVPSIVEQEFGVQPREFDIAKNTALLLKKVSEARKKNIKTVAKAKAKLTLPNP